MIDSPSAARISLGLLAGLPVLLLILATLGALSQTSLEGMPVVPWQTLWSLPLDRWLRDVAATIVLGFVVVGGLLLPRVDSRLVRIASLAALVWLAALIAQIPLTVSELLGRPLSDSVDLQIVWSLLSQTDLGRILVAQIILVALALALIAPLGAKQHDGGHANHLGSGKGRSPVAHDGPAEG